jgi:hypothetical protein
MVFSSGYVQGVRFVVGFAAWLVLGVCIGVLACGQSSSNSMGPSDPDAARECDSESQCAPIPCPVVAAPCCSAQGICKCGGC